jgi:hypothetical protein
VRACLGKPRERREVQESVAQESVAWQVSVGATAAKAPTKKYVNGACAQARPRCGSYRWASRLRFSVMTDGLVNMRGLLPREPGAGAERDCSECLRRLDEEAFSSRNWFPISDGVMGRSPPSA